MLRWLKEQYIKLEVWFGELTTLQYAILMGGVIIAALIWIFFSISTAIEF